MSSFLLGAGGSLLEDCPCLLDFISSVVYNAASEPAVLSFTLKLTGLLATSENGFKRLQVEPALLQLLISVGACKSVVESKTLSFAKPYLMYFPPLPPSFAGMRCSESGLQPSALAGEGALGGPLCKDWLDSGIKEPIAAPKGSQFLCKIR